MLSVGPPRRRQGEKLLRPEEETGRLSGLETESKRKQAVIRDLQDEIAAMAKTLAQAAARNEVELTQKLLTFHRELGAKGEEIKALREQISHLQKGSSQVFSHSLYERDLEIGRLRKESETLRRDRVAAAGLVTSLQRDIAGKEQKMQQLKQDVEKMKKENREKDNQLAVVSAKRIGDLERDLEGLRRQVRKYCAEQESIRNQLAEKAKAEEELEEARARQALQLQEMGRRERLLRADLGRAKEQVIEKVRQISEERQQSHEREKCLQEELSSRLSKEKEVSANIEVLQKSLCELQACLRSSCSSDSLRGELGQLAALCLDPSVAAIGAAVLEVARVPLSWLEGAERLLASAGMDPHASGKGLLAALRMLLENSQATAERNQELQAQLERVRETQAALLQEHVKELEAKHEQELQRKIKQIILEKDKENKEILESTVAQEKDKCKQSVEEEQRKIRDLEGRLRSMTEVLARKSEEQEVADCKLRAAVHELEETTTRETALRQRVLAQDEQLKTSREESELERQKLWEEMVEYKEQSKQHSLTIVALEDRLLEAEQQQRTLEEENAALVAKMEGTVRCAMTFLWKFREELAAVQSVLLSKEAVIVGLTKELAETKARMSDVRGELHEEQKVELERNVSRVKCQERELNLLREKLSQMSSLVEKKDRALKAASEELRCSLGENRLGCFFQEPASDLADLGAQCRGLRHEETIQRQKEGLAELRERIKLLEKRGPSAVTKKGSEPLVVLTKDLPEKLVQKMALEKEPTPMAGTKLKAGEVLGHVPNNGGSHRAMSLEMADVTDLSEKMYLDIIGALGSLMKVQELSGMQSLKDLPQEEREEAGLQRQRALELLYEKVRSLKSRLERKEEMLKDYEASVEQLRLSQASLRRCQEEMSQLEDEAYRAAEEKALLKEALERTQLQLNQEKRLLRAAKVRKPGAKKPFCSGKLKAKERTAEAFKTGSA
ncbi:forkhead-associated domain-containing protein 1 [Grus japonensis]|uniref:Forkhead-associated domain-containing protein 1 n=1 Tax=Grus japonensis TaxID=30415 RepID=A0ABC9XN32_GRUJA